MSLKTRFLRELHLKIKFTQKDFSNLEFYFCIVFYSTKQGWFRNGCQCETDLIPCTARSTMSTQRTRRAKRGAEGLADARTAATRLTLAGAQEQEQDAGSRVVSAPATRRATLQSL